MEIADPILNPGHSREYSRDTCIYGALIKSVEACIGLAEQKNVLNDVVSQLDRIHMKLDKLGCILNIDLSHNMVVVMYLFKKKGINFCFILNKID